MCFSPYLTPLLRPGTLLQSYAFRTLRSGGTAYPRLKASAPSPPPLPIAAHVWPFMFPQPPSERRQSCLCFLKGQMSPPWRSTPYACLARLLALYPLLTVTTCGGTGSPSAPLLPTLHYLSPHTPLWWWEILTYTIPCLTPSGPTPRRSYTHRSHTFRVPQILGIPY